MKVTRYTFIVASIAIILFLIPFLWLKPGLIDLGGDSSRLYYYQPIEYLRNQSLYAVSKSGLGGENLSFYGLPHFLFLFALKLLLKSPTLLIDFIYGLNLSLSFLFCFLIVSEFIKDLKLSGKYTTETVLAAIIAALYYILPPQQNSGWNHVILTFNQVFLNPLVFYLLLKFFTSRNFRYLAIALVTTLLFSPNFSYVGAPPFFAFYPFSLLFLLSYVKFIKRQPLPIKNLLVGLGLFLMLHLFQILPIVVNIFNPVSVNAQELFSKEAIVDRGLGYFTGIAGSIKISFDILGLLQLADPNFYALIYIVFPFLMLLGFLWNKSKIFILSGFFFLISLFWVTAKITNISFEFYKILFLIPGFSMFRNFTAQWRYLYLFFYSLLLGQALAIIFAKLQKRQIFAVVIIIFLILIVPAWPFIRGDYINDSTHWQSNQVKTVFQMDPEYEAMLSVIRKLPQDGKVLTLPFTDPGYQIISGVYGGAYEGPSTIAYLTPKQDFTGYGELGHFKDFFIAAVRNGDYTTIKEFLQMLNIKYIFYNADPLVYDSSFPYQPYTYMRSFFPTSQEAYKVFLNNLSLELVSARANKYFFYKLPEDRDIHEIYLARNVSYFNQLTKDWSVPLTLGATGGKGPAFFEYKYKPPIITNGYLITQPDSVFLRILKNPEPPLVLAHAFTTTPTNSFIYPLIVAKEQLTLKLKEKSDDSYLDIRFLLAAKRILELEHWGDQMSIALNEVKTVDDLISLANHSTWYSVWQNHNKFEVVLAYYTRLMSETIQRVEDSDRDDRWEQDKKFLINEYLLQHRSRLVRLIPQVTKNTEDSQYAYNLVDLVFQYLLNRLSFSFPDASKVVYNFSDSEDSRSRYQILVRREALAGFSPNVTIRIGDEIFREPKSQEVSPWINFGPIELGGKTGVSTLTLKFENQKNLITDAERFSIESTTLLSTNSAELSIQASLISGAGGLIWKVNGWHPRSFYVLSFDYQTQDAPFIVRMVNSSSMGKQNNKQILEDELYAHSWQRYQAVVQSTQFTDIGFIQFARGSLDAPISKLKLKNLALHEVPHPQILLKEITDEPAQTIFPTLTYTKINPTKYLLHINNPASQPLLIVLSQRYNAQWKMYQSKPSSRSIVFGLLSRWPFQSFNNKFHYEVNGYANAWYVDPKDLGNNTVYDLTLEMTAQDIFYAGLVVFGLGFGLLVYWWFRPLPL